MKIDIPAKPNNVDSEKLTISRIRDVINDKNLEPGDKLPSERKLSEKFDVSRGTVRGAIQKLEFFGLLKSIPQSGTFIANIGVIALNGIINDILGLDAPHFKSLVETRILLELKTVRLAALRRTEKDLKDMRDCMEAHAAKVMNGEDAVQEDLLFHLAIAKASDNTTMNMFMLNITPQIIVNFEKYHVCDKDLSQKTIQEHRNIYEAIEKQDTELAKDVMKKHFKVLYQYCYDI